MKKVKQIFKSVRVIILIIALLLAVFAINPSFDTDGVAIRSVEKNSSAAIAGIQSPVGKTPPRSREVIFSINNIPVKNVADYHRIASSFPVNRSISVKTNQNVYILRTLPAYNYTYTGETVTKEVTVEVFNETLNETVNVTEVIEDPIVLQEYIGVADLGLSIYNAPQSNVRKGLDLTGGTRVILKPEEQIPDEDMVLLLESIKQRLNVFGLSDIIVRDASDLTGNKFVIVEIAGATSEEVSELVAKQGKFEAKIANTTVFRGGNDITYVCRSADCSGLDSRTGCGQGSDGSWFCGFYFQISLSPEAARKQADTTKDLTVVSDQGGSYLSESLYLYLDDQEVDSLRIGASLKGSPVTDISITGSGTGNTQEEALSEAIVDMRRLQTVLITGSLPVKLQIERTDTLSAALGEQFTKNAILIGLLSIAAVIVTVFIRYRSFVIATPMVITMLSEATIILGIASVIGWNLDLAAIAGIIIAIGTGVDDQIVIADETLGKKNRSSGASWKDRMKNAFFIIFAAYFTLLVAMIPLWFAGAGLLRGFAITTILGVSVGVFITRPAYAKFLEIFSGD